MKLLTYFVLSLAELVYMRDLAALREQQLDVLSASLVGHAHQHSGLGARLHRHGDLVAVQQRALLGQCLRLRTI